MKLSFSLAVSELAAIFTSRKFPSGQTGLLCFLAPTPQISAVLVDRRGEQKQLAYLQLHISLVSCEYELRKRGIMQSRVVGSRDP